MIIIMSLNVGVYLPNTFFFFQSGEYLRLKVLDIQPELTKLGVSPEEAKELLHAHDEVLLRLQVNRIEMLTG